ncbi:MAG: phosphate ABC transporter substrate-binding protein PstS [Acidimicrobiales bacterium]
MGAACGKKEETGGGTGSTTGGTAAGGSADVANLSGKLQGSGATFPKPFYEEVKASLQKSAPKLTVDYAGGGSGKGKQDLADNVVDFAGSDSPVAEADLSKFKGGAILYTPTVAAPITVSYNLSGVDKLQLSPDVLANIFQKKITTWNNAAIAGDNPGVTLPSEPIVTVVRSDGSGTSSNFSKYLKAASPEFTIEPGDSPKWPEGTQTGNGNAGVAQAVKSTAGAIGYVDYSDAKATGLTFASIKNKAGSYVAPSLDGASAALAGAKINLDLTYNALNADGAEAYPITAGTWIIIYQKQPDATKGTNLKGYLNYILTDGQALAEGVDYAKLPANLQQQAVAQLSKIQIGG